MLGRIYRRADRPWTQSAVASDRRWEPRSEKRAGKELAVHLGAALHRAQATQLRALCTSSRDGRNQKRLPQDRLCRIVGTSQQSAARFYLEVEKVGAQGGGEFRRSGRGT